MIGKYEFNNYEDYLEAKNSLPKYENQFIHNHTIIELGIVGNKYCVDVSWSRDLEEEPILFKNKKIDLDNEGIHSFFLTSYTENKI